MVRKVNYSKILVIVFLTVLIWVWADRRQEESFSVSNATISVAKSTNPNFWVSFDGESRVPISKVVLKGSASRIADVKRKLNDGSLVLEFFLDPEQEVMTGLGQYPLNALTFLRRSDRMRQLGLMVESCEPDTIAVDVVGLVKRSLTVNCVDETQNPIRVATVEPAQVNMFVPADWSGEKLTAKVQMTRREIEQARLSAIEKVPYIELVAGQTRKAPEPVKIMMPLEADRLSDYTVTTATLGFSLSANLQGRYKVEAINLDELIRAITIRATPEAKHAYDEMRYQVILEIDDSDKDVKSTEPLRKELIYNFPAEYVRKDEIVLNQQPVTARFRLIPLASAEVGMGD